MRGRWRQRRMNRNGNRNKEIIFNTTFGVVDSAWNMITKKKKIKKRSLYFYSMADIYYTHYVFVSFNVSFTISTFYLFRLVFHLFLFIIITIFFFFSVSYVSPCFFYFYYLFLFLFAMCEINQINCDHRCQLWVAKNISFFKIIGILIPMIVYACMQYTGTKVL